MTLLRYISKRLITDKDSFQFGNMIIMHSHKILGFMALIHYFIRFTLFAIYGTCFFESATITNILSLLLHVFLSFSSFIFHVLKKKNPNDAYHIWTEMRLHNAVFSLRSILVIFLKLSNNLTNHTRFVLVMSCHLLADIATQKYGNKTITTVRNDHKEPLTNLQQMGAYYFSVSQIFALGVLLYRETNIIDVAFAVLFSIQFVSFVMTLKFKGIIAEPLPNIIYAISLFIAYIIAYVGQYELLLNEGTFISIIAYIRFKHKVNKYLLWSCASLIYYNT